MFWHVPGVHDFGIDHFTSERMVDDSLHTLALGVEQRYVGKCMVVALEDDCFNTRQAHVDARIDLGLPKLRQNHAAV